MNINSTPKLNKDHDRLDIVVDKILSEVFQGGTVFSEEASAPYYARKCLINQRNTLLNLASCLGYYSKRAQSTHKLMIKHWLSSINIFANKKTRENAAELYELFKSSIKTDYSDIVYGYIQTSRQFLSDADLSSSMLASKLLINIKGLFAPFITAKEINISAMPKSAVVAFFRLKSAQKKLISLSKRAELCYERSFKLQIPSYSLPPYEGLQRIELDNRLVTHDKGLSALIFAPDFKTLLNSQI